MVSKPEVDNNSSNTNSTQTAELINRNESHTELEISGNQQSSDRNKDSGELNLSESLPDAALLPIDKDKFFEEYIQNYLVNFQWYHGLMSGALAVKILKWENSFLVRRHMTQSSQKIMILSLRCDAKVLHYQISYLQDGFSCNKLIEKFPKMPPRRFAHIHELIDCWSLMNHVSTPIPRSKIIHLHESVTLAQKLGKGAFGEVFKGVFHPREGPPVEVAVKRAIGEAKRGEIQEFCFEAYIMSLLDHRNVVRLYAIATLRMPLMLVMEVVPGGDLKKYLQRTVNLPNSRILSFALDIARGMNHLAMRRVIHRDLAARNCLITNNLMVKISDFGLSVEGNELVCRSLKKAPIRWLSPETLTKGIFNEKTDVWAFGVVCTELLNRCQFDPLWPKNLKDVQTWIKENEHPHRVLDSNLEPKELHEIVELCCEKKVQLRPAFKTIKERVGVLFEQSLAKNQDFAVERVFKATGQASSPSPSTPGAPATPDPKMQRAMSKKRSTTALLSRKKSKDKTNRQKDGNNNKDKSKKKSKKMFSLRRNKEKLQLPPGMALEPAQSPKDAGGGPPAAPPSH